MSIKINRLRRVIALLSVMVAIGALGKAGWIEAKALLAQQLLEIAWSQSSNDVNQNRSHKPWPWFDSHPVAKLTWPDGQQQILLQGLSGQVMAFAPGLQILDDQSRDLGIDKLAQADTLVIGGHNDTHLSGLATVNNGDRFELRLTNGQIQRYQVTEKRIVDSRRYRILPAAITGEQSGRLLLITCYPFNALTTGGPMRYMVTATPV